MPEMASSAPPGNGSAAPMAGGLAVAAAIVTVGMLGSRLLGVVRQAAIADAFGASPELDAYNVAFRIPDLIFQLLAGATLASAFIPVFSRVYRRGSADAGWRLASSILNLVMVGTAALCVVAFFLAPLLVPLLAPGLGEDLAREDELPDKAVKLTRILLVSPMLLATSGIVTGILQGRQHFVLPAISPILYNLAIIFGAVALAGRWGVEGLAVGVVIGSGLHLAVQIPGLARERMRYARVFDWSDPAVREVGRLMLPRMFGLAAAQANFFITTTYFASRVGSSAISNLTYAWFLMSLPVALFGIAFSVAAFPRLADQAADGDVRAMTATISRVMRTIMFLTIPAALGLWLLAEPVTTVLFERGEFTAFDTRIVATSLAFYCIAIVPQAGIEIHSRGFYALSDTRTPVLVTVGGLAVNLVLSILLWEEYQHEGLAFALAIAAVAEWLALYWLYGRRTGAALQDDIDTLARFAACGAIMALFVSGGVVIVEAEGTMAALVTTVSLMGAGVMVYAGAAAAFGLDELRDAVERLRGLLRPKQGAV